ncbi:SAM-dependent methyltransferase [Kitasatospora sp. GAS204A]|uniref:class I SAM-dependent methyltransferase n=1 Tax=unclassified Kitasatospora TaxID=2633591 RepID=UPI002475685A|nr:class I SAM-dependent methyltransferase [Kitasatospora sp. GAS204B]MDH6117064.1 SAM-dependent methyltransferase [Kitasatospora sp. GAS204B]
MHIDGRTVFGVAADEYDRMRPDYPVGWLSRSLGDVASGGTVLDIGCGTGKLGRALRSVGFEAEGVEPDERMAAVAVTNGLGVDVSSFEEWDPGTRRYDVVACGQAWHWLSPDSRAQKARYCLKPGGRLLLVWNIGSHQADVADALARVYQRFADEGGPADGDGEPEEERSPIDFALFERELGEAGFEGVRREAVPWRRSYSAAEWRSLLATESGHLALPADRRSQLLDAVQRRVALMPGGGLEVEYECILLTGTRPRR